MPEVIPEYWAATKACMLPMFTSDLAMEAKIRNFQNLESGVLGKKWMSVFFLELKSN